MKKMYIIIIIIVVTYLISGTAAWIRGPLILGAKLKSIYPYRLSPITWIKHYEPSDRHSDASMKLGYSDQGKYKVNILTGGWEKLSE
jgi:hypothetical protein